jgi:hypothetical protein
MDCERPEWCPKCYLRIAPYEVKRVYRKKSYHRQCFVMLRREKSTPAKTGRLEGEVANARGGKSV